MIRRQFGRKAFASIADGDAKPIGGVIYGCQYWRRIDLGRVAELDSCRRPWHGDVHRGAVVIEYQVEVAEWWIVVGVLQAGIATQPLEDGFHLHQEGNQVPVRIAASASA